jgi:nucleoside 2-deoxyribosyltransferase
MVYLAGPITGKSYGDAADWRGYASRWLADRGLVGVSPMRWKHYLAAEHAIADSYEHHPLSNQRGLTARDRFDCQRCPVTLVNLLGTDRVSIGTMIELGWADAARNLLVLVMEPEGNLHDHAMVRELSPYRVATLEEGLELCRALLRT